MLPVGCCLFFIFLVHRCNFFSGVLLVFSKANIFFYGTNIAAPPASVMCILGKKYPATQEDFSKSGLKGEFEPQRAGKRMKLPVPETWETLLSAKGNKASTWEELIEHKKLPFMAMLRNIRNLIFSGTSDFLLKLRHDCPCNFWQV